MDDNDLEKLKILKAEIGTIIVEDDDDPCKDGKCSVTYKEKLNAEESERSS
jgi:hypothetical protein